MLNKEGWRPQQQGGMNPSARLRAARSMPQWVHAKNAPLPPPPPTIPDHSVDPDYEVIDFQGGQTYSNASVAHEFKKREGRRCDLCGSSAPSVRCVQCTQNFCPSCDDMYHRHPKRQAHVRKEMESRGGGIGGGDRPPLPPKGETAPPAPVPPPRRNKQRLIPTRPSPSPGPQTEPAGKPGLMGSLKRIIGGRQASMPSPQTFPPVESMMGHNPFEMHDHMGSGGFGEWDFHRGHRSGSFSNLNNPPFSPMMQAQSMAQLNCPGCHYRGGPPASQWDAWQQAPLPSPWSGMPLPGTWNSSAFVGGLNQQHSRRRGSRRGSMRSRHAKESSSYTDEENEEDDRMMRRRNDRIKSRGVSPAMSRRSRHRDHSDIESDEEEEDRRPRSRGVPRRASIDDGIPQRPHHYKDDDTMSLSGRRFTSSTINRGEQDFRHAEHDLRRKTLPNIDRRIPYADESDVPHNEIPSSNLRPKSNRMRNISTSPERVTTDPRPRSPAQEEPKMSKMPQPNDDEFDITDETQLPAIGAIPDSEWSCEFCTFVNPAGTRVCMVCCKTTTSGKKSARSESEVTQLANNVKKMVLEKPQVNDRKSPSPSVKKGHGQLRRASEEEIQLNHDRYLTSKGTSPPPQNISTQTYEVPPTKLKRATSLADYSEWRPPQRTYSRQSLLSDTQSLPVTPPKGRSPDRYCQADAPSFDSRSSRKSSDTFSNQRNSRRAGSQPPDYISTLVQKQVKQGLEMVKLLREAEEQHFTAEDLAVALVHCEDGDPVAWLQQNWKNMIDTVVTLGTNYGHERKENTVGTISASEARDALRAHDGNVWAAVTECVEQRQKKYAELMSRGNFTREDIVTVLTANHGNLEAAYNDLSKSQLKPFLMRIWGPPQGIDNDSGNITKLEHEAEKIERRGGAKNEEVSAESNSYFNRDRIQTWLNEFSSRKILSQSTTQFNNANAHKPSSSSLTSSESTSHQAAAASTNRRKSDVHRYLKQCFTVNDNTLKFSKQFLSEMEINRNPVVSEVKTPVWEYLERNLNGQNHNEMDTDNSTSFERSKSVSPVEEVVVNTTVSESDRSVSHADLCSDEILRRQLQHSSTSESFASIASATSLPLNIHPSEPAIEQLEILRVTSTPEQTNELIQGSENDLTAQNQQEQVAENNPEVEKGGQQDIFFPNEAAPVEPEPTSNYNEPEVPQEIKALAEEIENIAKEMEFPDQATESSAFSPVTAFHLDESHSVKSGKESPNAHFSEWNSERDVSSIPTDSIRDNAENTPKDTSNDIVNLLKESLAKDDVVERIVSTLLQTVLRASTDLRNIGLPDVAPRLGNIEFDDTSESVFYEAQGNQQAHINVTETVKDQKREIKLDQVYLDVSSAENVNVDDASWNGEEADDVSNEIDGQEREARRILAEGLVKTYDQAELAVRLMDLNFDEDLCVTAAKECSNLETALAFLQQECDLCAGKYTSNQMISMLECEHVCCHECARNYFKLQITERNINDCVCPFCKEPDLAGLEEDSALDYFSHLDVILKRLLDTKVHELFQRKLRDRTLMLDPNFKWCIKCSSGFIADPRQRRLLCPDCKTITCATCRLPWEREHEKMTCQEFAEWKNYNDPEKQLEKHLAENGITCPQCQQRYILAKGGCMHLTCPTCKHEFCSGCAKPFLMGSKCTVSEMCERLGLHSHHPRNCLFYLRDKDPPTLEKLLEDNGVEFVKENAENDTKCRVQLLKETDDDNYMEAICGFPVEGAGLCRTHYIEHLVSIVRNNKIDPADAMDPTDALQELRRHGKTLPMRADYNGEKEYLADCIQIVKREIPLE